MLKALFLYVLQIIEFYNMKSIVITVILSLYGLWNTGEDQSLAYISEYKAIAIAEMHRTGIPASIKLAQGLLESGAGRSTLAREANNHFGIKCGGSWEGDTFYRADDDHDKNGKLIESCFRKFGDATESYFAHSNFLTDQNRYAFLFDISYLDYAGWAKGLKKAGYATDKAYPDKLIKIIEKYQLYNFDNLQPAEIAIVENTDSASNTKQSRVSNSPGANGAFDAVAANADKINKQKTSNRTRTTRERKSKKKFSLFKKKKKTTKRSRSQSKSSMVFHIVQEGQSLKEIAMLHKLDETTLRLRNRIPKDAEPLSGEHIYLRKKISVISRPEFSRVPTNKAIVSQDEYIF